MDFRRLLGNSGEKLAEKFLKEKSYKILQRQWRSRFGEVDIICSKGEEIIFVEVKTRQSLSSGYPEDSVTAVKLQHMSAVAECYLRKTKQTEKPYRFDVIAIVTDGVRTQINHFEGV